VGGWTLLLSVSGQELLAGVSHGGRVPSCPVFSDRIAAIIDMALEFLRPLSCCRDRPIRIAAYRVASLQSGGLDAIVQNEGHGTCGGDARAEAAHLAFVGDGIAARWRCQAFHSLVGEPLRHAVCPHYVRSQRDRGV